MGKNVIFMTECHSTNTHALQLCQQPSTPEGTLVITDHQTAGRGQRGHTWLAEPGMNLTFSLILKPTFLSVQDQFFLNMAVSLGLYDYLRAVLHQEVCVKWPNDILVAHKKLCGILIENSLQGSTISASVVGIGLNVNQTAFAHPRAASIKSFSGKDHALQTVLDDLVSALERRYLQLRQRHHGALTADYYQCLYGMHEKKNYKTHETKFEGTITGVDAIGRLRIEVDGKESVFGLKEVELVE